jgi:hypothetical protein
MALNNMISGLARARLTKFATMALITGATVIAGQIVATAALIAATAVLIPDRKSAMLLFQEQEVYALLIQGQAVRMILIALTKKALASYPLKGGATLII